jgi:hypothetical protein
LGLSPPLSREQGRPITKYWLHFVGKYVGFVNFQKINMVTGIVRLHPVIDCLSQSERGIAGSAKFWTTALGGACHLQPGDNTSAITHYQTGGIRLMLGACMEIVVLKHEPASQDTRCLVDDSLPGAHRLTTLDFAVFINIETIPHD